MVQRDRAADDHGRYEKLIMLTAVERLDTICQCMAQCLGCSSSPTREAGMPPAGFLPFSAIYIELFYVFSSVWGHKVRANCMQLM